MNSTLRFETLATMKLMKDNQAKSKHIHAVAKLSIADNSGSHITLATDNAVTVLDTRSGLATQRCEFSTLSLC